MNNKKQHQICTKCIMDTTDPEISFDENGVCNHCREFDEVTSKRWFPNDEGAKKLQAIYEKMKKENAHKDYDCILGLSGGVDSSYLALKLYEAGIRPLVVHVDGGWNSELAVQNIENIVNYCGWHLHTIVIDWEEMKDLQLAYLKSGIANQDVPQDHAFFASLYHFATKYGVNYVVSGGNLATESILPSSWGYDAMDATQLTAIHEKFGNKKLKKYETVSYFKRKIYYPYFKKFRIVKPLDFLPYFKDEAKETIKNELNWRDYGGKHHESKFTKFFQAHWLPTKFGFDKRKAHLSSLIVSGQMTRDEALKELEKPLYDETELKEDKEFISKKLGISLEEFETIMKQPNKTFLDYPSDYRKDIFFSDLKKKIKKLI